MLIQRLHLSSYYPADFAHKEQQLVESLGHRYLNSPELDDETQIILSTSQVTWEKYLPERLAELKLIIHPNSGYDNFNYPFFKNIPTPVVLGSVIRCHAVAEYSMACLFQHFCSIPWSRQWDATRSFPNRKLIHETNILLYGIGPVGKIIHESLTSHRAQVTVIDPYKDYRYQFQDEDQFDAIIMASSLNSTNHQLINKKVLSHLSPSGCLINAARGKLIQQEALLNFLAHHPKSCAYLDVCPTEPFAPRDFDGIANLKLTSHIAGVHDNLSEKVLQFEQEILVDFNHLSPAEFTRSYQDVFLQNRMQPGYYI